MNVAPTESEREALAAASRALWLATLGLMTAFLQQQAPAHRLLLARRIGANFDTLRRQDCFSATNRQAFARLALRWQAQARRLAPAGAATDIASMLPGLAPTRKRSL